VPPFEVRFETPPGAQAQVDFGQFQVASQARAGYRPIAPRHTRRLGTQRHSEGPRPNRSILAMEPALPGKCRPRPEPENLPAASKACGRSRTTSSSAKEDAGDSICA
jgi:hypothetical protein